MPGAPGFDEDESGRHKIKIAGNAFIHVTVHTIPVDEEQSRYSRAKGFSPKGRLKLPALMGVEEAAFFEGYYNFLLAIKARKAFRVTELSERGASGD